MLNNAIQTVATVDLDRYQGTWFEIFRLPLKWEDETASDITATYSLNADGSIRVDNRCIDEDGKPSQAIGRAVAVDESNARLTVSFLPQWLRWLPYTKGDYWVFRLDPGYRIALVGSPDRRYLWLLAREPHLSVAEQQPYLDWAHNAGFDLARLIRPIQTGNRVSDEALAR